MYSYSSLKITSHTSHKLIQGLKKLKHLQSFHCKVATNYFNIGIQPKQENAVCICRHFL